MESEHPIAKALQRVLTGPGWTVVWAADGEEGLTLALRDSWDLIIVDVLLRKKSGWRVIELLRAGGSSTPVMAICTDEMPNDRIRALNLGVDDCVYYPCDPKELTARCRALDRRFHVDQVRSVWGDGSSPDMERLIDHYRQSSFPEPLW